MATQGPDLEQRLRAETDLLSVEAGHFRSKLISDFQLLDTITESGCKLEPPKYYTNDLTDKKLLKKIMKTPHSLVRFQVYSNKGEKSVADRRNNRVKNRNSKNPPLDLWAHWVVESSLFQNLILALILINCIVLGIQAEVMDVKSESVKGLKMALDIFDYCAMVVYFLEILLKWTDNFWLFWKNRWNIFDFVITFTFVIPEIINFSTGEWGKESAKSQLTIIVNNLRTFRVLRSLKMVSRFQKVRLIVLAVTKAFQAMIFIIVLLFIFAYIFAIIGVMFFQDSYEANVRNATLYYPTSFEGLASALITLFQLLTLDHWVTVYNDLRSVASSSIFAGLYVISWIIIGSFIFRNIFVGIMVNNFQSIRNELFQGVQDITDRANRETEVIEFAEELERQTGQRKKSVESLTSMLDKVKTNATGQLPLRHNLMTGRRMSLAGTKRRSSLAGGHRDSQLGAPHRGSIITQYARRRMSSLVGSGPGYADRESKNNSSQEELQQAITNMAEKLTPAWHVTLEKNLRNLSMEVAHFCWPRDTMFRYLLIMEAMQENLAERGELFSMIREVLISFHDS